MEDERLMIIDTDCGVDDAFAILIALSKFAEEKERWKVLAITTVSGNVHVKLCSQNVLRVLTVCQKPNVPVYQGSVTDLMNSKFDAADFHGKDGLGDVAHEYGTGDLQIQKENGIIKMTELAQEYKGKITMVTLGPLTNIALAQRIDPEFMSNLKEIVMMGGNFEGEGNATVAAEFNFFKDPEAADIVLSEAQCRVTILPWEACKNLETGLSWDWYDKWLKVDGNARARFLRNINANSIKKYTREQYNCCDSWAMAMIIEPKVIAESKAFHARVELNGTLTRGLMVLDKRLPPDNSPNVNVVTKLNPKYLMEILPQLLE